MAFWTDPKSSPVKKNNFLVSVSGKTNWWWAQSVTKPGFDIEVNEDQLTNHKYLQQSIYILYLFSLL